MNLMNAPDTPRKIEEEGEPDFQPELNLFSKIDIDFEVLHCRYFVMKIDLKIYYQDIDTVKKDIDSGADLKSININLRAGQIT